MNTSDKRLKTAGLEKRHRRSGFVHRHSLSIATITILTLWTILYIYADPSTHCGSFFSNAIADSSGVLVTLLATNYMYEKGLPERRSSQHEGGQTVLPFRRDQSVALFRLRRNIGWHKLFSAMDL